MAGHGRILAHDPRASIAIVAPNPPANPLASTRITLAGYVYRPEGDELAAGREAHLAAVPAAHRLNRLQRLLHLGREHVTPVVCPRNRASPPATCCMPHAVTNDVDTPPLPAARPSE
jgi:hypothetical protein